MIYILILFSTGITQSKLDEYSKNQECKNPETNTQKKMTPNNSDNIKLNNPHTPVGPPDESQASNDTTKMSNPLMVPTDIQKKKENHVPDKPASTHAAPGIP